MKELSIEEKAKAYDEALKQIKECTPDENGFITIYPQEIFPELRESKGERIRKDIIWCLKHSGVKESNPINPHVTTIAKDAIAWLEKQGENPKTLPKWKYKKDNAPLLRDSLILNKYGCVAKSPSGALVSDVWVIDYDELAKLPKEESEKQGEQKSINPDTLIQQRVDALADIVAEQKPTNKVEPKFKVGDWIKHNKANFIFQISKVTANNYEFNNPDGYNHSLSIKSVDKKYHLWTIQDAKDGDVLDANGAPFIYKKHNKDYVYFYCGVNLAGKFIEANGIDRIWNSNYKVYPATKEQHDLLFSKMKEAGYEWDAEKKKLKKIKYNPVITNPKFKEGDKVYSLKNGFKCTIESIDETTYYGDTTNFDIKDQDNWKLVEQKPVELTEFERYLWNITSIGEPDENELKELKSNAQGLLNIACKQRQELSEKDEEKLHQLIHNLEYNESFDKNDAILWLKSLKDRVQPQNIIVTDEELAQAKKDAYNDALDKIEYYSGEPTFDDGWSAAIWYLKKKNAQPQNTWKPSEEDEKIIDGLLSLCEETQDNFPQLSAEFSDIEELKDWLKSLRPQSH